MMKDKKLIAVVIIIIGVTVSFLLGYHIDRKNQLKAVSINKNNLLYNKKSDMVYGFDSISLTKKNGNISAWAVVKGVDYEDVIPNIIIKDQKGNIYKLKTRIIQRNDITKLMNDGHNYGNCGIYSQFLIDGLYKNQKYAIGIQIKNKKYFVWTNKKLDLLNDKVSG